ncbi:MAG: hypothetical protein JWO04_5915 [Gammaproteobacteria bacterium]|nr:hypothetical protein [Gammaproteobacteria bacterium]
MIAGHFGLAAAIKWRERQAPLWALMLATVWLDIIFVPLFLTGVETIQPVPGTHGGYGAVIIRADYTHSLVGALGISAIFGGLTAVWWGRRTGFVLGAVVFSHWLLDLVVHRADMPILPGGHGTLPRLGLGLWRFPNAAMSAELALVIAGAWLYWRAARETAASVPSLRGKANLAGLLVLVFGVTVLVVDVLG